MCPFLRPLCLAAFVSTLSGPVFADAKIVDIHDFGKSGDGRNVEAAPTLDPQDNVFGVTQQGGTGACTLGCGTVYEITHASGGGWTESILYSFQSGSDGEAPRAPLVRDKSGALYGIASTGQFDEDSLIYRLSPPASGGSWTFSVLQLFDHTKGEFLNEEQPLILKGRDLFSVTASSGGGTLFKLSPSSDGSGPWKRHTLFSFNGEGTTSDAIADPTSSAIFVAVGRSVVSLLPPSARGNAWTQTILHTSQINGAPYYLTAGSDGTIYGLTTNNAVFSLAQTAPGVWTKHTLHKFGRWGPLSLLPARDGTVIGAVSGDPDFASGYLFRLTPSGTGAQWPLTKLVEFRHAPNQNPAGIAFDKHERLYGTLDGDELGSVYVLREN